VIEEEPVWGDASCVALEHLLTADGEEATEAAITEPAHWAVSLYEDDGYADAETGEIVAEETIDWSTQDDDEATPAEGMRHAHSVVDKTIYRPEWYCVDYQAAGLQVHSSMLAAGASTSSADDAADEACEADDGDDRRAQARAAAEAERAEALRRERRKVIALNRLGEAAMNVRREFVTTMLTRLVDCTSWVSIGVGPAV
jgi:ParB family chromosome partitioning protein